MRDLKEELMDLAFMIINAVIVALAPYGCMRLIKDLL